MKKTFALFALLSICLITWAQTPVIVTKEIKTINGKNYYAHVVEKGQTVFSIARAYGVNYHDAVLKSDIDKIAIGDTVFLPTNEKPAPTQFHYYVVKQGNTLYSIAKTYQVEVDDILKLNPKIENNNIKVGEVIKIPMEKSAKDKGTAQTSKPQQNSVNSQSQQPAPVYKPIKDSKQEAKEQKELEKQQKEAEAKAKKEQERLQKEAKEKEAKEKKELERQQKEAQAKEAKEKKELEKQQKEAEAKAKKEQERLQKEAEAKEAKEKKELEKKQKELERQQKEAKEKEAREKKELEKQQKEAEAKAKKEQEQLKKDTKDKEAQERKELDEQKKEIEKQRKELEKQQKELERQQKELEKKQKEVEKASKSEQQTVSENNVQPQNNPKAEFRPMGRKSQQSDAISSGNGPSARLHETTYETEPITKAEPAKKISTNPATEQKTSSPSTSDDYNYAELPLQTAPNIGKSVPAPNVLIRNRVSNTEIHITLMIPLYLSSIDEISTSKFDIEQRKKRKYKSFEFIQFYEGVLLGLESLKNEGCNVVLNVVDIPGDLPDKVAQAFDSYNVAQSDLIIALLEKNAFEKAAQLAQKNNVFILNPFSSRAEILDQNPYVVKLAPSNQGLVSSILSMVTKSYSSPNLYIVHSNGKLEKKLLDEFQTQLKNQNKIKYTIFDWSANAKLANMLKNSADDNIVINIYDQNKDKNKTQSSLILNRMFSVKKNTPTLITIPNWATKYEDIDYNQLQRLNYHFLSNSYLDYNNPKHKNFIDRFKEKYKTEPQGNYAALGNDIIIHFVAGINSKGTEKFWEDPNTERRHSMIYYFHFKRSAPDKGFENQNAYFYRLNTKFQFVPAN
ncbi:MAG: LysM peptidoglycan-binding domain-containing protein [Bacteroidales bacterium]|nr:LysM peptidoglycan-binding domain-containing protein [Bacteroidales bacterium]